MLSDEQIKKSAEKATKDAVIMLNSSEKAGLTSTEIVEAMPFLLAALMISANLHDKKEQNEVLDIFVKLVQDLLTTADTDGLWKTPKAKQEPNSIGLKKK